MLKPAPKNILMAALVLLLTIASLPAVTHAEDVYDLIVDEFSRGTIEHYMQVVHLFELEMQPRHPIEWRDSSLYYYYAKAVVAAFEEKNYSEASKWLSGLPDGFADTASFRHYVQGLEYEEFGEYGLALAEFKSANGIYDSVVHILEIPTQPSAPDPMIPAPSLTWEQTLCPEERPVKTIPPRGTNPADYRLPPMQAGAYVDGDGLIPVYTGPGSLYFRNGETAVQSGSMVSVIGYDGSWALIAYGTSTDDQNTRRGYVPSQNLNDAGIDCCEVPKARIPAVIAYKTNLYDNINMIHSPIRMISANTRVSYLAYDDSASEVWAYVELTLDRRTARGFVLYDSLLFY